MDLQKCIISDFLSLGNQIYDYASFDHGIAEQSAILFMPKCPPRTTTHILKDSFDTQRITTLNTS